MNSIRLRLPQIIAAATMLLLAGCAATPKPSLPLPREPLPPLPTAVPLPNEANVRFPDRVKAYQVNRYRDPRNPSILHESHAIYRLEEGSRWKLDAPKSQQVIVGPVVTDGRKERQPAPLALELIEEQRQARKAASESRLATEEMRKQQIELVRAVGTLLETTKVLASKVDAIEAKRRPKPPEQTSPTEGGQGEPANDQQVPIAEQ